MKLVHGRIQLELHERRRGEGAPLLLLHALRGSSEDWETGIEVWRGPVYALDFSGHGRSEWLTGGAYTPELLTADADAALAYLSRPATLVGAGLGAYVALLLAGARPAQVNAALLLPGLGLEGGGPQPDFDRPGEAPVDEAGASRVRPANGMRADPMLHVLDTDVRPMDYAEMLAGAARRLILLEDDRERPPWWQAVRRGASAETARDGVEAALSRLCNTSAGS